MHRRPGLRRVALFVILAACGGTAKTPLVPAAAGSASASGTAPTNADAPLLSAVTPSRLLPNLVGTRGVVATENGVRRLLIDRMRVIARGDGSLARATELFPVVAVSSVALPSRLGGGFVFYATQGGGTDFWRADEWLGKLTPVVHRTEIVNEAVAGFDRLYLRVTSGNRLVAMDPTTGEPTGLGALPPSANYGQIAFADGWRAVADTDLRGPLATFDAGISWHSVGISEKVQAVGVVSGDPAVMVTGGRYVIDARGTVSYRLDAGAHAGSDTDEAKANVSGGIPAASLLGKSPLRAALEDGWPIGLTSAIVARGGALARVSLVDGSSRRSRTTPIPMTAPPACHAVRLGLHGIGFVCGEPNGPTTIYEYVRPLAMRRVLGFARPRFVASSGNGALVIREPAVTTRPSSPATRARTAYGSPTAGFGTCASRGIWTSSA